MTKTNYILSETRKKPYVSPLLSVVVEDMELGVLEGSPNTGVVPGGGDGGGDEDPAKMSVIGFDYFDYDCDSESDDDDW